MPLTLEQEQEYKRYFGLPDHVKLVPYDESVAGGVEAAPESNPRIRKPIGQTSPVNDKPWEVGSALRAGLRSAPAAMLGGMSIPVAQKAAKLIPGIPGKIAQLGLPLASAIGTSMATGALQNKGFEALAESPVPVLKDIGQTYFNELTADLRHNPKSTILGGLLSMPLGGFSLSNPFKNIPQATVGAGLGVGSNIAFNRNPDGSVNPTALVADAIGGAMFNGPRNRFGNVYHDAVNPPFVPPKIPTGPVVRKPIVDESRLLEAPSRIRAREQDLYREQQNQAVGDYPITIDSEGVAVRENNVRDYDSHLRRMFSDISERPQQEVVGLNRPPVSTLQPEVNKIIDAFPFNVPPTPRLRQPFSVQDPTIATIPATPEILSQLPPKDIDTGAMYKDAKNKFYQGERESIASELKKSASFEEVIENLKLKDTSGS